MVARRYDRLSPPDERAGQPFRQVHRLHRYVYSQYQSLEEKVCLNGGVDREKYNGMRDPSLYYEACISCQYEMVLAAVHIYVIKQ